MWGEEEQELLMDAWGSGRAGGTTWAKSLQVEKHQTHPGKNTWSGAEATQGG